MSKYFKNDSSQTFRISKDRILRVINNKNHQEYIALPIGINFESYKQLEDSKDSIILTSITKSSKDFFEKIKVSKKPQEKIIDNFAISLVYDSIEYQKALDLLHREHYILNLPNGLPIILKKDNDIIGVIYFSKLTHGNPDGRINFLKKKRKLKTNEEIREYANLHFGCISRIVIDSKYQGDNAGKIFVENLGEFLSEIFINNQLLGIEVMTSWTLEEFQKKNKVNSKIKNFEEMNFEENSDFFCRASYERISQEKENSKSTKNARKDNGKLDNLNRKFIDKNGVITHSSKKVLRYYYLKQLRK